MNQVNCPVCGKKAIKFGKTNAGAQRWICKECRATFKNKIDNNYC